MATTVDGAFDILVARLAADAGETEAAKNHRASVKSCLERNFGMTNFFRTGSFGHGTSVSGYSDVDYFAVIPRKNLKSNSASTLRLVKEALDTRFPYTNVHVDSPAVVLPFGVRRSETTEIVPVDYIETDGNGYRIYDMPDNSGNWMEASPSAHTAYVHQINERYNGEVKSLIRLIKAWKYYREVPISSFYLEMYVAEYSSHESAIIYRIDIRNILDRLFRDDLPPLYDPTGVTGFIHPCKTSLMREEARSKIATAQRVLIKHGEPRSKERSEKHSIGGI